ncbi:DUF179 domain-containing protein, partial [Cephalotus follicularis]
EKKEGDSKFLVCYGAISSPSLVQPTKKKKQIEFTIWMKNGLLLLALFLIILTSSSSSSPTVDSESNGIGEWQILTKQNFSSQIRLHTNILLFVTLPWSGESRSLMKDLSESLTKRKDELASLKLMFMYRNTEKTVADAIGATEEITILYYHHSVSYKYLGKLGAPNILHSIYPYLSLSPEQLPLTAINSQDDLSMFLDSTDKAVLLFDFCGWTPTLLAKLNNNVTQKGFNRETDRTPTPREKDNQKGMENGKLKCGIENGFSGIPWLGDFCMLNDSDPFRSTETIKPGVGMSCTFEEFKQFDSFFSKFMTIAREHFLPPERHRFGMVSEASLISSLGVRDPGSWSAMLYFTGCPSCSKILKESNDIKSALKMDSSLVKELEDGQDLEPDLPSNEASVLLFVDRSSDSLEARRKSKEALDVYRRLALHYQMSYQMDHQNYTRPEKFSAQAYQVLERTSGHPGLKLFQTAQRIKLKDKMSIMIMTDGKHVNLDDIVPDLQGTTLHGVVEMLLQKKKEAKLSSLAKEVGFNLLSDDVDIKISDESPSQTEVESSPPDEVYFTNIVAPNKYQLSHRTSMGTLEHVDESKPTGVEPFSLYQEKKTSFDASKLLLSADSDHQVLDNKLGITTEGMMTEGETSSQEQLHFQGFRGSFFFCDGNYRLLKALTGRSIIPSLVIVDPISQRHYVFSKSENFSYSSMVDFLHGFLNGSLLPYQRSESIRRDHREAAHPPFVTLDFREVDSIPQVTTHTFTELVLGFNQSNIKDTAHDFNQSNIEDTHHAWNEDVLVLFSTSWCGFCQRMELVVREAYRAIKGYMKMLNSGSRNEQTEFRADNLEHDILKPPLIYLLDCTLNDCNSILKSINQKEVYPALILFPAERKNAVSYKGDMTVADILKFIANYGSNSQCLRIPRTLAEKGGRNQEFFKDSSGSANPEEAPTVNDFHEVLLKNRAPKRDVKYNLIKSQTSRNSHESAFHVVVGSILIATDKLLNAHPFDKSQILIVKVDQNTGFQGLIFNKHISWDTLHELQEGLELLKEAPLSFGGPVIERRMPLVALTRRAVKDQLPEVLPSVYFLDQLATVHESEVLKSGNQSITDYWFFLGYSSWGWSQLINELSDGAWNLSDHNVGQFGWPSS